MSALTQLPDTGMQANSLLLAAGLWDLIGLELVNIIQKIIDLDTLCQLEGLPHLFCVTVLCVGPVAILKIFKFVEVYVPFINDVFV